MFAVGAALVLSPIRYAAAQSTSAPSPDVRPDAGSSSADDAQIKRLIEQLSDDNPDVRRKARAALVKLGPAAENALEEHLRAREEAESTLSEIEGQQMAAATEVTAHLKDVTAVNALAQLSKLTGYDLRPANVEMFNQSQLPLVSIEADHRPFWEVVQKLCGDGQIMLQNTGFSNSRTLLFMPSPRFGNMQTMDGPSYLNGAFLFSATVITRSATIQFGAPNQIRKQMNVQIELFLEPKVRITNFAVDADECQAMDDKGASLKPEGQQGPMMYGGVGTMLNFNVPLKYVEQSGGKIANLQGQVKLTVRMGTETAEIADVTKGGEIEKELAGQKITLRAVKQLNPRQYQAQVVFNRGEMAPQVFQQASFQRMQDPGIRLFDDKGREFQYSGMNSQSSDGNSCTLGLMFFAVDQEMGQPKKLIWEASRTTREIPVTFKFSDLPLP
jgi:hypothetical protein